MVNAPSANFIITVKEKLAFIQLFTICTYYHPNEALCLVA